jgi:hypothetical protein
MITDYKNKKLVEYLKPGGKYLIRFGHGLGDTMMFMPAFYKLKEKYPESQIDIYLECGQEHIFESCPDKEGKEYDEVFHLDYPMVEHENGTKTEKCCREELGIDALRIPDVVYLKEYESPLVACHFQGTALPNSVNCPPGIAQQIWIEIIEAGKIPIEVHFEHMFHNPVNTRYGFIDRHVRSVNPDIKSLIGLLQRCHAFVGIASGPFVIALSVIPQRVMFLERKHKLESYIRHLQSVKRIHISEYEAGSVEKWLGTL